MAKSSWSSVWSTHSHFTNALAASGSACSALTVEENAPTGSGRPAASSVERRPRHHVEVVADRRRLDRRERPQPGELDRGQLVDERSGVAPVGRRAEQQRVALVQLVELAERRVHGVVVEAELVVVGEVVGAGRPQRHPAHRPTPPSLPRKMPLSVPVVSSAAAAISSSTVAGRLDPGLLEQALAVDEEVHVDDLRHGPQVAVVGEPLDQALVEVGLGVAEDRRRAAATCPPVIMSMFGPLPTRTRRDRRR